MAKFVTIGERLSTTAPAVNKAFTERDPEPIIKRAKQQLDAGAVYLPGVSGSLRLYGKSCIHYGPDLPQVRPVRQVLHPDADRHRVRRAGDHGIQDD